MRLALKLTLTTLLIGFGLLAALTLLSGCGKAPQGPAGSPGAAGAQGSEGPQGMAGADAPGVTVVQLCPGMTTYPTTFVEVAYCIGGNLYATYSTNGGFSTELPPGAYSSDGVGSNCSFTVGPNCSVGH